MTACSLSRTCNYKSLEIPNVSRAGNENHDICDKRIKWQSLRGKPGGKVLLNHVNTSLLTCMLYAIINSNIQLNSNLKIRPDNVSRRGRLGITSSDCESLFRCNSSIKIR